MTIGEKAAFEAQLYVDGVHQRQEHRAAVWAMAYTLTAVVSFIVIQHGPKSSVSCFVIA